MATFRFPEQPVLFSSEPLPKRTPLERKSMVLIFLSALVLGLGIAALSFLYLLAFNQIASQGIVIIDLERERNKLLLENEVWNMRISKLKSLDVIEKQKVVKQMETVNPAEIQFIQDQ